MPTYERKRNREKKFKKQPSRSHTKQKPKKEGSGRRKTSMRLCRVSRDVVLKETRCGLIVMSFSFSCSTPVMNCWQLQSAGWQGRKMLEYPAAVSRGSMAFCETWVISVFLLRKCPIGKGSGPPFTERFLLTLAWIFEMCGLGEAA